MNRTIKFRGLHKGKWVYGSYVTDGKDYHAIVSPDPSDDEQMLNQVVSKESVGQLIDIKIKDGDVYEGDRVALNFNYLQPITVEFKDGSFNLARYSLKKAEVIGNIHQDQEGLNK